MALAKDLAQVNGVIKTASGYRYSDEFLNSFDTPFLLLDKGIVRFDKGKFNSYYILCITDKAQLGIVKINKDLTFNSVYIEESNTLENRYNKEGKLICQYFIDGNIYTKSTDGSKYEVGKGYFNQGDKEYFHVY